MVQYHTHTFPTATKAEVEAGERDDVAVSPASLNGAALPIGGSVAWDDVTGKPATFPPTLPIVSSGVSGLDAALADRVRGTVRLTVAASAPSSPAVNDVWIDTT